MELGIKIFGSLLQATKLETQNKVLKNTLPESLEFVEFNVFNYEYASLFDDEIPLVKRTDQVSLYKTACWMLSNLAMCQESPGKDW
jgi:hypothetical protein